MNKVTATTLTAVAAVIAVAAPVLAALYLAQQQGRDRVFAETLAYAKDVVRRTDETSDQIAEGIRRVSAQPGAPCSDEAVQAMRSVDLESSYIQAFGYVSQDRLVCSSLGPESAGIPVGPIDFLNAAVSIRLAVSLPFARDDTFLVVEQNGYAAIVHHHLPIDVTANDGDLALAAFAEVPKRLIVSRGDVNPAWVKAAGDRPVTFTDDRFVVAIAPSLKYRLGGIAALPLTTVNHQTRDLAIILVPVGLGSGIMLLWAVLHLARLQLALPAVLRAALRRNEFHVVYEPIVELVTGRWIGVEALLRWRRPSGEWVRPDLFIPVAEDTGLIGQVTERVLDLVTSDARMLVSTFPDLLISVNLSSSDVESLRTVDLIGRMLVSAGVPGQNLIVEITERSLIHPELATPTLRELRSHGVRIAIDDFGTGYCGLSYLGQLHVDFLKVDRSFIAALNTEAMTSRVGFQIIAVGKAMHLELIAEGVETPEQVQLLIDAGVRYGQGWFFAREMPASTVAAILDEQRLERAG